MYDGPLDSGEFLLLASFSCFRFKLTEENVSSCLQPLLGDSSEKFLVSFLDNSIFHFAVSCKEVGFLLVRSPELVLNSLKLGFFMCNDLDFQEALYFSK